MIMRDNIQIKSARSTNFVRMAWIAAIFLLVQTTAAIAEDAVGRVGFLRGTVTATDIASETRQLKRGDTVRAGDTIETDAKSVAKIIFSDQSVMYIKSGSKIKLEAYHFTQDADSGDNASVTEVLKGGMRSITGLIGQQNPENVSYRSGDTTIGIRGTAVEVDYRTDSTSVVTFDFGHGFVRADRDGFCIRKPLTYGDTLIIQENDTQVTETNRSHNDPSRIATRLVLAEPDEAKAMAGQLVNNQPFEDSLLTIAMLREVSQFSSQSLASTVEGMSAATGGEARESLVRNATMMYPAEGPSILEAATRANMGISMAVTGVMCGLQGKPAELTDNVIQKAIELGITAAEANEVLSNLQNNQCS